MIITCSACQSKFTLDAQMLAPTGKQVRCSQCGEIWLQTPDPDEILGALDDLAAATDIPPNPPADAPMDLPEPELTDSTVEEEIASLAAAVALEEPREEPKLEPAPDIAIPEGVKPLPSPPEDSLPPRMKIPSEAGGSFANFKAVLSLRPLIMPALIPAGVFIAVFSLLLLGQGPVMRLFPASIAFYDLLGLASELPGEGLVFDQVKARMDGSAVVVEGNIINLKSEPQTVPMMEAHLRMPVQEGEEGEPESLAVWRIEPPQSNIESEKTLPFTARFEPAEGSSPLPKGAEVFLRFTLK